MEPLVSVISPCYNVGLYIERYLDSLLCQTYKKLEIILVNDGSTDNTGELIKAAIPALEKEGYSVIYIEQENGGQSSAVNNALKRVTGEFLTWPDPDDWLTPDSIEKRVIFLQTHPEVGMVRGKVEKIDVDTQASLGLFSEEEDTPRELTNIFDEFVFSQTWFPPVGYMVRMSYFDLVLPEREIYVTPKSGQNWQLMLPISSKYPTWQIPDICGYYSIRSDSHSRGNKTIFSKLSYLITSEETLTATLMKIDNAESYLPAVHARFMKDWAHVLADNRVTMLKHITWLRDSCNKEIALAMSYERIRSKCRRYRILSKITLGSSRQRYKDQYKHYKNLLQKCENLRKSISL